MVSHFDCARPRINYFSKAIHNNGGNKKVTARATRATREEERNMISLTSDD